MLLRHCLFGETFRADPSPVPFMRPIGLVVLLAFLLPSAALPAQGPVRMGRVRGVVFDSLLGAPLPGATVFISPGGQVTRTDSTGRFTVDSIPPGEWTVAFNHPALDSIGLGDIGTLVRVFAGASVTVTLASRPIEAFRDRFCAGTADSLSSTVAFGGVGSADGSKVSAAVAVSWISERNADGTPHVGTVRTIPSGDGQMWVACGIPRDAWLHASLGDSARLASAIFAIGPRGVAVHTLVVSSGRTEIAGRVRDRDGSPVRGARISVVGTELSAFSDASGGFVLADAPAGTVTLDVRTAGRAPWLGALEGGAEPVEVQLLPLGPIRTGPPRGSDYLRLQERRDREGLVVREGQDLASDTTSLSSHVPVGTCRWWLDGRPVEREFFLAQPRWAWRAVETYARGRDAPPEYRSPTCGVALLWTAAADW